MPWIFFVCAYQTVRMLFAWINTFSVLIILPTLPKEHLFFWSSWLTAHTTWMSINFSKTVYSLETCSDNSPSNNIAWHGQTLKPNLILVYETSTKENIVILLKLKNSNQTFNKAWIKIVNQPVPVGGFIKPVDSFCPSSAIFNDLLMLAVCQCPWYMYCYY